MAIERPRTCVAAIAFAAGATFAPAASGQYAGDPYFDDTLAQSRALGLEMIGSGLRLAEALDPPFEEELAEVLESMTGADFMRFGGTLAARDPALASELAAALGAVQEAVASGDDPAPLVAPAQDLLTRAYDTVIERETRDSAAFRGALIADLLLVEGGVAEGYEEAVEDVWEYPRGWAALGRVEELWSELEPLATEQRREDGREMVAALRDLFPDPGPPDSVVGWNPEEAEAPAQRLAGIVEEVVNANLYPGRDLPRVARHLSEVTRQSCEAYAAGDGAVGAEAVVAALDQYENHLADVVGLFAPELHAQAEALFAILVPVGDDEEGEEGAAEGQSDADAPDEDASLSPEAACGDLSRTLADMSSAVGG